ncbi:hypothetical protein SAMN02745216_02972 [Desulfatibacillum alkenivorans DSM 16219]|uniref:Uncharacterized protein n=1 Tax=Desulfatibacillum alkenivorans DSM 16219 TaxID=1121393 RepID=A0A1M6Q6B7_9BACT|nr:hypothetical protein [Desulfatibacillum alkenivorans]SHK15687.1 hypothetical protein SAMN02745216_02972 [Desulfatibacillum alkenivorans DSM 16219]
MKNAAENTLLSRVTAEFLSQEEEEAFLRYNWKENKVIARNTLAVLLFLSIAFFVRDVMEAKNAESIYALLLLRIGVASALGTTLVYIQKSREFIAYYSKMLLITQILMSLGVFVLSITREMIFAYLGVNTILLTLIFYQFLNNEFYYTIAACAFLGVGSLFTSLFFLDMDFSGFIGSILFLIPINFLGVIILRSNNRTRRLEYVSYRELAKSNERNEELIKKLRASLDEINVLRGFIPICAYCKKVRDDEGYWKQIESYLEERSNLEFSHGMCPDCAEKVWGEAKWYKDLQKEIKIK